MAPPVALLTHPLDIGDIGSTKSRRGRASPTPDTVMVSMSEPTCSATTCCSGRAPTTRSVRNVANPGLDASNRYAPGGRPMNSKCPLASLCSSCFAWFGAPVSTSVTPEIVRLVESTTDPETLPKVCAAARNPATLAVSASARAIVAMRAAPEMGLRLRLGFNMAPILLSRLVARTIAGAGSHTPRRRRNDRAMSSRCHAYAGPSTPRRSTTSSQACSASSLNRRQAIHTSGLNQWKARSTSAVINISQS